MLLREGERPPFLTARTRKARCTDRMGKNCRAVWSTITEAKPPVSYVSERKIREQASLLSFSKDAIYGPQFGLKRSITGIRGLTAVRMDCQKRRFPRDFRGRGKMWDSGRSAPPRSRRRKEKKKFFLGRRNAVQEKRSQINPKSQQEVVLAPAVGRFLGGGRAREIRVRSW